MDLLYYIDRAEPEDKEHLRRQWADACNKSEVTCKCGQKRDLKLAFRCLYCGQWLCTHCAEKHFGKTIKEYEKEKHGR